MRKNKTNLDYFSHDVNMFSDKKIKFVVAKFGLTGYAVFIRLLEEIYQEGYYIVFGEKELLLFADANKIDINVCKNIIDVCINEELFSITLFNVYNILTSRRIQQNYIAAHWRRQKITFIKEFLLVDPSEYLNPKNNTEINIVDINSINVNINTENVNINSIDDDISTQTINNKQETIKQETINSEKEFSEQPEEKEFSEDSEKFVKWLLGLIPSDVKVRNTKSWRKAYDDLIRIDKYTKPEIIEVCKFARSDEFWKNNFYSPVKLRNTSKKTGLTYFELIKQQIKTNPTNGVKKENTTVVINTPVYDDLDKVPIYLQDDPEYIRRKKLRDEKNGK